MARRNSLLEETAGLRDRLYLQELDRWTEWLIQQDKLRALLPKALHVLEQELDAGGPTAVKVALALVQLLEVAVPVDKPHLPLIDLAGVNELRARLAVDGAKHADPPMLPGQNAP